MDIMNCPISFWQRRARGTSNSHNQELLTFRDSFEEKHGEPPVQTHLCKWIHRALLFHSTYWNFLMRDRKEGKPQPTTLWEGKKPTKLSRTVTFILPSGTLTGQNSANGTLTLAPFSKGCLLG